MTDDDAVRAAIHTAFGGLPVPRSQQLIQHSGQRDPAGEKRIRQLLAGRSWQSLDADFLNRWWSSFCYLSPQVYRYYLPALMINAFEPPIDPTELPSAISALQPSFWALYYHGEDRQLLDRQAVFTDSQYEAVSAYLGLVHTLYEPWRGHLAAQALRWGWNRLNTPAYQAAQAYYRQLHTYRYEAAADPQVAALCAEIQTAFAGTSYPGDDQLCGSEQGDEPAEYAMELRGLRWQRVHPELLARCYAALSFLSDTGFRYFLPAFLIADLLEVESNADPVFHLTHGLERRPQQPVSEMLKPMLGDEMMALMKEVEKRNKAIDWRNYSVQRFAGFSRAERRAIIRYLEYRAVTDEYSAPGIHEALASYWRPSAEPMASS